MGLWDKASKLASKGMKALSDEVKNRQDMYNHYYDWASRQSDERLKEDYKRKRGRHGTSTRELMEMKALTDILQERGYGSK